MYIYRNKSFYVNKPPKTRNKGIINFQKKIYAHTRQAKRGMNLYLFNKREVNIGITNAYFQSLASVNSGVFCIYA